MPSSCERCAVMGSDTSKKIALIWICLAAFLTLLLGCFLGAFVNDSLIHHTACREACLRDGSKIYHQSGDICVCADMRTMRRGPVSCVFRGTP